MDSSHQDSVPPVDGGKSTSRQLQKAKEKNREGKGEFLVVLPSTD
jgi:hypothetical protein